MKRALITGIFGQDGSYLAELLTAMEYDVHGVIRQDPSEYSLEIRAYLAQKGITPVIHTCNLCCYAAVRELLQRIRPAECYHLAAVHYAAQTALEEQLQGDRNLFEQNTRSTLNLLYAIRDVSPKTRYVLAGSCVAYDACGISPQDESVPFRSSSVYGLSKITAGQLTALCRSKDGLHASTAILYNHESPRRHPYFVTRKIVRGLVKVKQGQVPYLEVGNVNSVRDWGYAGDYVHGMWLMAQADAPGDYILATGTARTVEDFLHQAADVLGIPHWRQIVKLKPGLTPSPEQTPLIGNPRRAQTELGWAHSISFRQLVERMVLHELQGTLD